MDGGEKAITFTAQAGQEYSVESLPNVRYVPESAPVNWVIQGRIARRQGTDTARHEPTHPSPQVEAKGQLLSFRIVFIVIYNLQTSSRSCRFEMLKFWLLLVNQTR